MKENLKINREQTLASLATLKAYLIGLIESETANVSVMLLSSYLSSPFVWHILSSRRAQTHTLPIPIGDDGQKCLHFRKKNPCLLCQSIQVLFVIYICSQLYSEVRALHEMNEILVARMDSKYRQNYDNKHLIVVTSPTPPPLSVTPKRASSIPVRKSARKAIKWRVKYCPEKLIWTITKNRLLFSAQLLPVVSYRAHPISPAPFLPLCLRLIVFPSSFAFQ